MYSCNLEKAAADFRGYVRLRMRMLGLGFISKTTKKKQSRTVCILCMEIQRVMHICITQSRDLSRTEGMVVEISCHFVSELINKGAVIKVPDGVKFMYLKVGHIFP